MDEPITAFPGFSSVMCIAGQNSRLMTVLQISIVHLSCENMQSLSLLFILNFYMGLVVCSNWCSNSALIWEEYYSVYLNSVNNVERRKKSLLLLSCLC